MSPYLERMVLDADPLELVRMLYERALDCIEEARRHLAAGRIPERSKAVVQAIEVISELQGALRDDAAPQLSRRLRELYDYVQFCLTEANFQQKEEPLKRAIVVLSSLLEAWTELAYRRSGPPVETHVAATLHAQAS